MKEGRGHPRSSGPAPAPREQLRRGAVRTERLLASYGDAFARGSGPRLSANVLNAAWSIRARSALCDRPVARILGILTDSRINESAEYSGPVTQRRPARRTGRTGTHRGGVGIGPGGGDGPLPRSPRARRCSGRTGLLPARLPLPGMRAAGAAPPAPREQPHTYPGRGRALVQKLIAIVYASQVPGRDGALRMSSVRRHRLPRTTAIRIRRRNPVRTRLYSFPARTTMRWPPSLRPISRVKPEVSSAQPQKVNPRCPHA